MPLRRPSELSRVAEPGQSRADDLRLDAYNDIVQWREIVEWNIATVANGVNIDYERFPYLTHGVIVELRVWGKAAGGAAIAVTLKNNGTAVAVAGGAAAGTVYTTTPSVASAVVTNASKLTLDIATGIGWLMLVVQAIIEPTVEG